MRIVSAGLGCNRRRRALAALALAVVAVPAFGQERTLLHAGWTFAPGDAATRPDASAYRAIAVPGTFEDHLGPTFDGSGWYRCPLAPLPASGKRARVEFMAAATEARVYFNGQPVGAHLGGWTPFRVDLPAPRGDGTDLLEVYLDEKVGHNTQGFHPIIQPHFGGLWQDVVLCVDATPTIDRLTLLTFGDGATSRLQVEVRALPGAGEVGNLLVVARIVDGAREVAAATAPITPEQPSTFVVPMPAWRPWSPRAPHLYRVQIELRAGDTVLDRVERRVGFRDLRADGQRLLLNGEPLSVRGMLHWGYEPPLLAPNPDPAVWRREMEDLRARGFNMVKACLWLPPPAFFAVADELGMLVWQEYPTWHPKLTPEHKDALIAEFGEFFLHDRSHACAAFRSLTCETGHGADLAVIRALYDSAKTIPQALVVDDSSWIEWLRLYDFYDDHPYGNNSWWPGKLAYFKKFIGQRQPKPLLLGECIAADTWLDRAAWERAHGSAATWFAPRCLPDQPRFEAFVEREFGADTLRRLLPASLAYALRMRKYQIERLRLDIPTAGYTVSVLRDFTLARMGMYDSQGEMKWPATDWAWHGDTMLCLDTANNARAFVGEAMVLPVRVAHAGAGACNGRLQLRIAGTDAQSDTTVAIAAGAVSDAVTLSATRSASGPQRLRLHAELEGSHPARNSWDVWQLPAQPAIDSKEVRVVSALDADTLALLRHGGRVLLCAGDRPRSLKTQSLWFLRGAAFAPPHPIHARVPGELLEELQTFDLETDRVLLWDNLQGQVDPILAFWETHDIAEVRAHLFAFDCRVGEGRLLATTLNLDSPAGQWLLGEFKRHLLQGAAPRRGLSDTTLATLAAYLDHDALPLPEWDFRTDPRDEGLTKGFAQGNVPTEGWRRMHTRSHWESQGVPHYDGVAWYRCQVEAPEHWQGKQVTAVFEGVDDSFRLFVNGHEMARFGDPAKGETVWLQRVTADITAAVRPGQPNVIVLRVVDHGGAGGVYKPVFLTTGPADAKNDLLHQED